MQSGTVLLAFSYFEVYFREVVEDIFSSLAAAGVRADVLTPRTRIHCAIDWKLAEWAEVQDPSKRCEAVWNYVSSGGVGSLHDVGVVERSFAERVLSGITYPKPDNIKKMLVRLGINNPVTCLRRKARMNIDQYLIGFHDARVDLAHNGNPPGWAEADYDQKIEDLLKFSKVLDRVLCQWFCERASISHWPRQA